MYNEYRIKRNDSTMDMSILNEVLKDMGHKTLTTGDMIEIADEIANED